MPIATFPALSVPGQLVAVFPTDPFRATGGQAEDETIPRDALPGYFFVALTDGTAANGRLDLLAFGRDDPYWLADSAVPGLSPARRCTRPVAMVRPN